LQDPAVELQGQVKRPQLKARELKEAFKVVELKFKAPGQPLAMKEVGCP
jgi:hypothetical protein